MWGCLYYREEPHKARHPPPHILNDAWGALLQASTDGCLIFFPCLTVGSGVIPFYPTFKIAWFTTSKIKVKLIRMC